LAKLNITKLPHELLSVNEKLQTFGVSYQSDKSKLTREAE